MEIQDIIFEILKDNPQMWIRYFRKTKHSGLTSPGEYIELRSGYIGSETFDKLLQEGFKIETIKTQKINADVYSDIFLKREVIYNH
ncbi:hypothetical protein [Chryseobacterium aquaticum]|uniref:Uncharacterized protein n=1 Tax=Chryseobacterium aquaticum subsp. greenlandense TaxID=345663 RepID=A0A124F287_9FLAO|nr:hypothetical protein [Chryseobacterium aquaticum]KUJ54001.1 hypothetical protein AR686_17595 [Chryseobacterium aquaticum subsp. greenlandense]